jgi:hypothetical protein
VSGNFNCTAVTLITADVNNDRKLDLVSTCREGYVVVLLGNGDGSFKTSPFYTVPVLPGAVIAASIGDVNGDDQPDLLLQCSTGEDSTQVIVLPGGPSGTFTVDSNTYYTGPIPLQDQPTWQC